MTTASISGARLLDDRWTLRASAGAVLDGTLESENHTVYDIEPGGFVAVGLEYHATPGDGVKPFVDMSLFLGSLWTQTVSPDSETQASYFAADARLGARAGWTVKDNTFPYAAIRVFGGPVHWEWDGEDVTGTDIHHYQIAVGTAVQLKRLGIYFEWAGFGEQGMSAGLSTTW